MNASPFHSWKQILKPPGSDPNFHRRQHELASGLGGFFLALLRLFFAGARRRKLWFGQ